MTRLASYLPSYVRLADLPETKAHCDDCTGRDDQTWCAACGVHHDFTGFTHADWSQFCSCGCRCTARRMR